jgi:hypothetical protein
VRPRRSIALARRGCPASNFVDDRREGVSSGDTIRCTAVQPEDDSKTDDKTAARHVIPLIIATGDVASRLRPDGVGADGGTSTRYARAGSIPEATDEHPNVHDHLHPHR